MLLYCITRSSNGSNLMKDLKTERGYLKRLAHYNVKWTTIEFFRCTEADFYATESYKTMER